MTSNQELTMPKDRLTCFFCGRDLSQAMNVQYVAEGPICSMCLLRISPPKINVADADDLTPGDTLTTLGKM